MTTKRATQAQISEAVSKAVKMALMEATDSGVGKYAEKVDKLVEDQVADLDKLIQEGEDLMKENPTHDYAIQERNHLVMARIGILKSLRTRLIQVMEDLYRNV